ncbi:MAG: exonuclease [Saprospiraceae bacterium]|nr:MAG: exonuclease [Saprospiraceae bacterium]
MNFIIYDIEATCWEGNPMSRVQEVIEIGAVRINQFGEYEGEFNRFIKPILHPNLSLFCRQLTSIEQENINRADQFPAVIEDFQDWAEMFDDEYMLCSWGNFDKKILIQDCQLHDLDYDWAESHINIRRQYHEIKRLHRTRGLKSSVTKEGFDFTGNHHRGIDDAKNLAKIFGKYLDEWRY